MNNNESKDKNPTTEYDSPCKDILQIYFSEFMHFFFPTAYTEIDCTKQPEFLDKELTEAVPDAEISRKKQRRKNPLYHFTKIVKHFQILKPL